jgi:hypothetical protein
MYLRNQLKMQELIHRVLYTIREQAPGRRIAVAGVFQKRS